MSIVAPRAGKFQITLHRQGLVGYKSNAPTNRLLIPRGSVTDLVLFPKPEDCKQITKSKKPSPASLVLLRLEPPVLFQNKSISQVCFQLPWEKTGGAIPPKFAKTNSDHESPSAESEHLWKELFVQSLEKADKKISVAVVPNPASKSALSKAQNAYEFSSFYDPRNATTTARMPFVRCYQGVNDGALYPLKEGLLFFK